jgi:hypothetical protein
MRTRPLGDMLTDVAGSLLDLGADQRIVRATSVELTLPIDVKVSRSKEGLIFCADVPAWRWRTDWDPPFGQLRLTLEETRQEIEE